MTPKQEEKLRNKIAKIKRELAADKRQWGGYYRDSRGMRYLPPELFIKLKDYSGGLRYLNWFNKVFPDDCGYPIFLFEWSVILFKQGKIKEAEKKVLETFFSNTYIHDKFLGKEFLQFDKYEHSNWEYISLTNHFTYSKNDIDLIDFANWLESYLTQDKFLKIASEFISIQAKLKDEHDVSKREKLLKRERGLLEDA